MCRENDDDYKTTRADNDNNTSGKILKAIRQENAEDIFKQEQRKEENDRISVRREDKKEEEKEEDNTNKGIGV